MSTAFKECYKVNRSAIEQSYAEQMGLKMNEQYDYWAEHLGIELLTYFLNKYRGVSIEIPKQREKSPRSLLGKIKNLQIERLSKLYVIDGLTTQQMKELYCLIEERIKETNNSKEEEILNVINSILNSNIEDLNITKIENTIMLDSISNSTKTALLRILYGKIENSNLIDKQEKMQYLDKKYGEQAKKTSNKIEDDIIKYNSIEELKHNKYKLSRLRNEKEFLKANDLRGMKIVVTDISDDLKTENVQLANLLEERKNTKSNKIRAQLTHLSIVELGKDFYTDLENNKQLLEKLNLEVIPGSNKHKNKSNGYEAQHIKFYSTTNKDFTMELQFKSEYVETISKGEGSASHESRPGKERKLPMANTDNELMQKINYIVPKYKIFKMENGIIKSQNVSMLNNVIAYFQGQIFPGSEQYEKIIQLYSESKKEKVHT